MRGLPPHTAGMAGASTELWGLDPGPPNLKEPAGRRRYELLLLSHEERWVFQQFFVALHVLVVFDAFVFADAGPWSQH
jgi:hypothetical protein